MSAAILIVGAGPTGLVLALSLARRGIALRIVSDAKGPGEHSRAMAVHARTLEFYRQFGFADDVVARGVRIERVHMRVEGRERAEIHLGDIGGGLSPYPFVLDYPQDDHERFLVDKLAALGAHVEWQATLVDLAQGETGLRAEMVHNDGRRENADFVYVCGCDGAHSQVRRNLGVGFDGGTYDQHFFVADVRIDGPFQTDMTINIGKQMVTLLLPVRGSGMQRLVGLVPPALTHRETFDFEDVRADVEPLVGVHVSEVNWFSSYRVHHRVAANFQVGRAFLLGDAGHIHSPMGGQGMNTGIGDAINLGWKLADVMRDRAPPSLLDSYEPERIAFARSLVATTDRAFTRMIAEGPIGERTRRFAAPLLAGVISRLAFAREAAFRAVSQTQIHYPDSPLSQGAAGAVHGGDRLPWTGAAGPDNFAPLASLDWQAHAYGEPLSDLAGACAGLGLAFHHFPWSAAAGDAGLAEGAAYLVRPDGYVAAAVAKKRAAMELSEYMSRGRMSLNRGGQPAAFSH